MRIEVIEIRDGVLVELRITDDDDGLFARARVPLEHIPKAEKQWLTKLAENAQRGDQRSSALLIEAVQGALIIDDDASAMRRSPSGDSPA